MAQPQISGVVQVDEARPNWGYARRLFERSGWPLDAIAREMGTDVAVVIAQARVRRWSRMSGLDEEVASRTQQKALGVDVARRELADAKRESYVEIASDLAADVLRRHRLEMDDLRTEGMSLHRHNTELMAVLMDDSLPAKERLETLKAAADVHRKIVDSATRLIELERKAWNLGEQGASKGYEELLTLALAPAPVTEAVEALTHSPENSDSA